jgi:hypothetical protein
LVKNPDERHAMVGRAQAKLEREYNVTRLRGQVLDILTQAHDIARARRQSAREDEEQRICQTQ